MKETKNKIGRPSELVESLVKAKEYLLGGWEQYGDLVPSVAGLACYLGKNKTTMYEYAKLNDEFSNTLESIKTIQENKLLNGGLGGTFNSNITKLMLSNHGYSDKQEVDHKSTDGSMSPQETQTAVLEAIRNKYAKPKGSGNA